MKAHWAVVLALTGCVSGERDRAPETSYVAAMPVARRTEEPPPVVRVIVGGDVIPHRPRLDDPERLRSALEPLAPLFARADVVVANYETATGDPSHFTPHSRGFAASAEWMAQLFQVHVDAITVANNHSCDLGVRGLERTLGAARSAGLIAAGADEDDPWVPKVLWQKDGRSLCAIAWTTFLNQSNACAHSRKLAVAPETPSGESQVAAAIRRSKKTCTATIAIAHAGIEYEGPSMRTQAMARAAAEAGAVAVLMHHPHVVSAVRAIETKDGRRVPFFASLGNLVSNQGESWTPAMAATRENRRIVYLNAWTRLGMLADLRIELGDAPKVAYGQRLIWIDNAHAEDRSNPHPRIATRLLDRAADEAILAKLSRDVRGPTAVLEDSCNLQGIDGEPSCR